jgi:hypothetical protein
LRTKSTKRVVMNKKRENKLLLLTNRRKNRSRRPLMSRQKAWRKITSLSKILAIPSLIGAGVVLSFFPYLSSLGIPFVESVMAMDLLFYVSGVILSGWGFWLGWQNMGRKKVHEDEEKAMNKAHPKIEKHEEEKEKAQLRDYLKNKDDVYAISSCMESVLSMVKPSLRDGRNYFREALILIHALEHIVRSQPDKDIIALLKQGDDVAWRHALCLLTDQILVVPLREKQVMIDRMLFSFVKMDPVLNNLISMIRVDALVGEDGVESKKKAA